MLDDLSDLHRLAWSPTADFLAVAVRDAIVVLDLGGKQHWRSPRCNAYNVAWSPDGRRVAAVDTHTVMHVFEVFAPSAIGWAHRMLPADRGSAGWYRKRHDVAWSPDGRMVAAASPDAQCLVVWGADDGEEIIRAHKDPDWVPCAVSWSHDSELLAAGSLTKRVIVWRSPKFEVHKQLLATDAVYDVVWSPDDSRVAWSTKRTGLQIYDGVSGESISAIDLGANVSRFVWSRTGEHIFAITNDKDLHVIHLESGRVNCVSRTGRVRDLSLSPRGDLLAIIRDGRAIDLLATEVLTEVRPDLYR